MATPHVPAIRPAHQDASPSLCKAQTAKLSGKSTSTTNEGETSTQAGVENDADEAQMESVRRSVFQKKVNQALNLPDGYLKVAVLIIRWDKTIDEFTGHCEEVSKAA
jgi:hypothetical protein